VDITIIDTVTGMAITMATVTEKISKLQIWTDKSCFSEVVATSLLPALRKTVWNLSRIAPPPQIIRGGAMELEEHYGQLLGITSPWEIYRVELKLEAQRVDIWIEYTDDEGPCPECG